MGRTLPSTDPYQQSTNPDVLDIVFVNDFVLPVYLTALQSARITYLSW
jgi:hypothetical protein